MASAVSAAGFDIIVGAGQSNALQSDEPILGERAEDARVHIWEGETSRVVESSETYLLPEFAREYVRTLAPERRVLLVSAAEGATGFTTSSLQPCPPGYKPGVGTWNRELVDDPENLYLRLVTRVTDALHANAGSRLVCLLWSQGESDCIREPFLDEREYAARLDDLIVTFRADVGVRDLPAIIGSMVPEWYQETAERRSIARALEETPSRLPFVSYVWGPSGLPKTDEPIHWATEAQQIRGTEMATSGLARALRNTDPVGNPLADSAHEG
ncbi:sialate O-acetylesterase [Salinibacterium sp. G-O1]|uniref:sialate O-acetylesterase n=1 Tax=Salinibacterium sp. G-O1 TaxID=3046208 RepID=UPI0024B9C7F1|nr:sialate O-acetylesterase [Salinibacterium sp. G-O1]MDJ0334932.1 sialate O-acetylesterase [Salinibacterium sp. G-O1]